MNKPLATKQPHVHAEVIKAWADGAVIQFEAKASGEWCDVVDNKPCWHYYMNYRVKPSITHKIGNIYEDADGNKQMLVASDNSDVLMVSIGKLLRGCRVANAVKVKDLWKITEEEFSKIVCGNINDYTLIEIND